MQKIGCGQIWGGNRNVDVDLSTSSMETSLRSISCSGGKGGDIYFYSVCKNDRLSRIFLGDVVGHGDGVSHISKWVYDLLVQYMNSLEGNNILANLNNTVHERGLEAMTTATLISYYISNQNFYYSYAGHHPTLIRRQGETTWWPAVMETYQDKPNLPLGIVRDLYYWQDWIQLNSGDCLLLYTDGVTEAPDANHKMLGTDRLVSLLNSIPENDPPTIKNAVFQAVEEYCGGVFAHDDITAIVIKIN